MMQAVDDKFKTISIIDDQINADKSLPCLVDVYLPFLYSISSEFKEFDTDDEIKTVCALTLCDFIDYLHRRDPEPEKPEIIVAYHQLAAKYKVVYVENNLFRIIQTFSPSQLFEVHMLLKKEQIDETVYRIIFDKYIERIFYVNKLKNYDILYDIVSEEYKWTKTKIDRYYTKKSLEDVICELALQYFEDKDVHNEHKNFVNIINKIHLNALSKEYILKIAMHPFITNKVVREELQTKLNNEFINIGKKVPGGLQRNEIALQKNCFTQEQFDLLKVGDIVDVKDYTDAWYVAKIISKVDEKSVRVTFSGFASASDETISNDSFRVAPLATCTNGTLCKRGKGCRCFCCK